MFITDCNNFILEIRAKLNIQGNRNYHQTKSFIRQYCCEKTTDVSYQIKTDADYKYLLMQIINIFKNKYETDIIQL